MARPRLGRADVRVAASVWALELIPVLVRWSERGYIDRNTTVMVIDANTDPESWAREAPAEAQLVYTTIPRSAEAQLVHDKNIFGEIPHHLKVKAQTYTSWPHDEPTGAYGYPVPRRATILLRTPLPEIPT